MTNLYALCILLLLFKMLEPKQQFFFFFVKPLNLWPIFRLDTAPAWPCRSWTRCFFMLCSQRWGDLSKGGQMKINDNHNVNVARKANDLHTCKLEWYRGFSILETAHKIQWPTCSCCGFCCCCSKWWTRSSNSSLSLLNFSTSLSRDRDWTSTLGLTTLTPGFAEVEFADFVSSCCMFSIVVTYQKEDRWEPQYNRCRKANV